VKLSLKRFHNIEAAFGISKPKRSASLIDIENAIRKRGRSTLYHKICRIVGRLGVFRRNLSYNSNPFISVCLTFDMYDNLSYN